MDPDFIFIMKWIFILFVLGLVFAIIRELFFMSPEQKKGAKKLFKERIKLKKWGTLNSELICPHCRPREWCSQSMLRLRKE